MSVFRIGRAAAPMVLALASGMSLHGWAVSKVTAAESQATRREAAVEAVREALQREAYGLEEDREAMLSAASAADPKLDAAHWHRGFVKDDKGNWVDHEQFTSSSATSRRLSEYRKVRETYADTAEGQLALADWCAKRKLFDQERAHLARVIDHAPDHLAARQRLGFVRLQGNWVSREEIARDQIRQREQQKALAAWRPVMQDILEGLQHKSAHRREKAIERLMQIHDPAAIPALDEVIASAGETEERLVLDVLRQMTDPEASRALARHAIFSPSLAVREAAAAMLSEREFDSFMPELLASMYSPVTSRITAMALPTGRIGYRHEFIREGQDQHQLLVLDTEYRRVARAGGSRRESATRALDDVAESALQREMVVEVQNQATRALNDRILWVLSQITKQSLAADPAAWWNWWNERNEVFVAGEKSVATVQQTQVKTIVDYVPDTGGGSQGSSSSSGGGSQSLDCLAAGSLVWTIDGPRAIETLRVGDMVLAQHPETGELTYKPVLKTTVRPKGRLLKINIGGEEVQTSGGHLFWVSGEGWVKSRNLRAGMVLHGASGIARVQSVEEGDVAETYNLVVADFNTYFVGAEKVLSHDNTVRQATRAIVPGLAVE